MFEYGALFNNSSFTEQLRNTWYVIASFFRETPFYWYIIALVLLVLFIRLLSNK